jgi:hypothetical protein
VAAVVVLDQAAKWWAWRHAPRAIVNTGGTWFVGRPLDAWLSGPVSGPLLDLLDVGLLILAGSLLIHRPRGRLCLVSGALVIGGCGSNLLDRLGMHDVTAPGSARGASTSSTSHVPTSTSPTSSSVRRHCAWSPCAPGVNGAAAARSRAGPRRR